MKNKIVILLLLLSSFAVKAQRPIPIEEGGNNTRYYYDRDRDGYGDPNAPYVASPQSGYVTNNRDCNDFNPNVYPGAPEKCDGKDNNCNNQIDEIPKPLTPLIVTVSNQCGKSVLTKGSSPSGVTWYWQSSSSGTSTSNSSASITRTSGSVYYLRARNNSTGCWSSSRSVSYSIKSVPSIPNVPTVVNNCGSSKLTKGSSPSGVTWYWQSSLSGTSTSNTSASITRTSGSSYYLRAKNNSTGCWSSVRTVNYSIKSIPSIPSVPTIVNNCGSSKLTKGSSSSGVTWYWQSSASGTSTSNSSASITRTSGSVYYLRARNNSTGCWSSVRTVNYSIKSIPSIPSVPTVVNNCGNSKLTKGSSPSGVTWYWQSSSSGTSTSNSSASITRTSGSSYYLRARNNSTGCWSSTRSVNYAIKTASTWYADTDGDGYGNPASTKSACTQPVGFVTNVSDYDDTTNKITNIAPKRFYLDADNDGFGDPNNSVYYSVKPAGYVSNSTDQCPVVHGGGNANGCLTSTHVNTGFSNENYVVTKMYRQASTTPITDIDTDKVSTSIQYFDGLGRSKQSIAIQAGSIDANTNKIPIDWALNNTGSTGFYNKIGAEAESKIISGTTPFGDTDLLWECINTDNGSGGTIGPDGGWNSDFIDINNTKSYRFTVWVKRTGSQNGATYHGIQNVNNLNGTANENPYFWSGDLPLLNTWYLMVGIVHSHDYTGADIGVSGVYDKNGNKVLDGKEYKWSTSYTTTRLRDYLYYTTDTSVRQYFWSPLFEEINGSELPLNELVTSSSITSSQSPPKDIITHYEYDALGRQTKEYLPYARATNKGSIITGDVATATKSYYQTKHSTDFAGVPLPNVNAYSEKQFDNSPLNRVQKQAAPGDTWKLGSGHEIKFEYQTNVLNEVKIFEVTTVFANGTYTPSLIGGSSYYDVNELYKTVTKDENWTAGLNHTTEEFKNKDGQVILKRTYNENQKHDTYYVYDDFGNLTYVLPPKIDASEAASTLAVIQTKLNDLGYQYKYDYRNRLVEKKIPGKGWEHIVYDKLDRPVLTQDANLKAQKKWLFTKYDILGRVVYTGVYTHATAINREAMQTYFNSQNSQNTVNAASKMYEKQLIDPGVLEMYYSNTNFPNTNSEVLTVNYYDNYVFYKLRASENSYGIPFTSRVKGLATGSRVKVLGTNSWVTTITYYDEKARSIYVFSINDLLNTIDIVESKLDAFTGKVLETKTTHKKTGKADIVTVDRFEYDHMDRLINQTQKINNQVSKRLVKNNYDELGQLESKFPGNGTRDGYTDVTSGLSISNGEIRKNGAIGWNEGLATLGSFTADGYVEFIAESENHPTMVGLSKTNTNANYNTIGYAVYLYWNKALHVYEFGKHKGNYGTFKIGDVLKVERIGSEIHYKKNGETFYISKTPSSGTLLGDVSMYTNGGKIKDLKIVDNNKGLQKVDYKYNVRGWLKNINEDGLDDKDLFNFTIKYNDPTNPSKALYNGNISQTSWNTLSTDKSAKIYTYSYDALNRITTATGAVGNKYNVSGIEYDKNGNIKNLTRNGFQGGTNFTNMDKLVYTYDGGNKLKKVLDNGNDIFGFKDGANATTEYIYDVNGNMTKDLNKGISNITYNHLNLPTRVTIDGKHIDYKYAADGTKLRKTVNGVITQYAGNYIYKNNTLEFFNHSEGYVSPKNASDISQGFKYVYQYKDHLGNVRLSYADNNNDGVIQTTGTGTEIIEESNYYPFGLKHKGYNGNVSSLGNSTAQKFGFGGKELNQELGIEWMDFGARNYDAALGRWMNLDPLAEMMRRHSPYNYAFNNPIYYIDPDGMAPKSLDDVYLDVKTGKVLGEDGASTNNVRVIRKEDFNDVKSGNNGSTTSSKATAQLQSASGVVTVNENKIQSDVNNVNNETVLDQSKERQTNIVLKMDYSEDIPTGEVTSIRGADGVDGKTTMSVDVRRDGVQTVKGGKNILLGQVHSHNKTTTPGMVNGSSTSNLDLSTSNSYNTPIYAIDSYTGTPAVSTPSTGGTGPAMHKVSGGVRTNFVGTTATLNVGRDALKTHVKK